MSTTKQVSKDFFSSADRMSIAGLQKFLTETYLQMDPKFAPPLVIWGVPGCAKSAIIEQVFAKVDKGLKTVILSQIGALDTYGMPHVNDVSGSTEFTPTETFGRGKQHLFLDEMNNAAPSVQAAVQNLMSAKRMGNDDYSNVFIIAACNPPSTNSLASDLNHPIMSRCLHVIVDYVVDDFVNYAINIAEIHPAITAFHKQTEGSYLQAKFSMLNNRNYEIPEPSQNEPFPTPRSWSLASQFLQQMTGGGLKFVDWQLLRATIQGCVGIGAAEKFAQTYAYMNQIPDASLVFSGKITAEETKVKNTVLQYITMFAVMNYCINRIVEADSKNIKFDLNTVKDKSKSKAYELVSGIHRSIVFLGDACAAELAQTATNPIWSRMQSAQNLSPEFVSALYKGIDPEKGLTRESIIKYARKDANNRSELQKSLGE